MSSWSIQTEGAEDDSRPFWFLVFSETLRCTQQEHATSDIPINDRRRKRDLIAIVQSDEAVGRTGDCRRRAADQFSLFEADNRPDARNHRANAGQAAQLLCGFGIKIDGFVTGVGCCVESDITPVVHSDVDWLVELSFFRE